MLKCAQDKGGSKKRLDEDAGCQTSDSRHQSLRSSFFLKACLLGLLSVQCASLNLLGRWSRVVAKTEDEHRYAKTTAVVVCEFIKFHGSFLLLCFEQRMWPCGGAVVLFRQTFSQPLELSKLIVPAALYVLQNNLMLIAAENLEGPVLLVLSQAKILTTAVFSILLLKKTLVIRQWVALAVLACSVAAVQASQSVTKLNSDASSKRTYIGLATVLVSCTLSGLSGVYFEKLLKDSDISVWVRNIHLSLFGFGIASAVAFTSEAELIHESGFFAGYDLIVWLFVGLNAGGGLLVAAVIMYTDNILKGFATSAAIFLSYLVSRIFFDFQANRLFSLGALGVTGSIFLYGDLLKGMSVFCTFYNCIPLHDISCERSSTAETVVRGGVYAWCTRCSGSSCELLSNFQSGLHPYWARVRGAICEVFSKFQGGLHPYWATVRGASCEVPSKFQGLSCCSYVAFRERVCSWKCEFRAPRCYTIAVIREFFSEDSWCCRFLLRPASNVEKFGDVGDVDSDQPLNDC